LRPTASSAASPASVAVAITARSLRRLFPAPGLGCGLDFLRRRTGGCGRFMLRLVRAIANVVVNGWFGKLGLERRRLVWPLFFGLLFAPLRTVAHPSAHIALVTRWGRWRQCCLRFPPRSHDPHLCDSRHTHSVTPAICRSPRWMLTFYFRQLLRVCIPTPVVSDSLAPTTFLER
jgi:hypothetical protein